MSLSTSTVEQKVDRINSLLTCLRQVHFRGMTAGFLSPCIVWRLIALFWRSVIVVLTIENVVLRDRTQLCIHV